MKQYWKKESKVTGHRPSVTGLAKSPSRMGLKPEDKVKFVDICTYSALYERAQKPTGGMVPVIGVISV